MTLQELRDDLKLDIGDAAGILFKEGELNYGNDYLDRCIRKSIPYINRDLGTGYAFVDDSLSPDPPGEHKEALLLRSHAFLCSLMRSITANNYSFTSADKKVDKTKQPEFWKEQEEALLARYKEWVKSIKPENMDLLDENILHPGNLTPQIYEIESEEREEES